MEDSRKNETEPIQQLVLANRKLTALSRSMPSTTTTCCLTELNLSKNLLRYLDDRVFSSLGSLAVLDLSFNQLNRVSERAFEGLTSLRVLDLSHNHITHLAEATFQPTRGLTTLLLFDNKLANIHTNLFAQLASLRELDISFNLIRSLDGLTFRHLTALVKLNIGPYNKLTSLHPDTFASLAQLRSLDLSLLDLSAPLSARLFDSPSSMPHTLAELYLFGNPRLQAIDTNCLLPLARLELLCPFEQELVYRWPRVSRANHQLTMSNVNLCVDRTHHSAVTGLEYDIRNGSLADIRQATGFVWNNITPCLAVVAGANGCGKSRLLRLIQRSTSDDNSLVCKTHQSRYNEDNSNSNSNSNQAMQIRHQNVHNNVEQFAQLVYATIDYTNALHYLDFLILCGYETRSLNAFLATNSYKYRVCERAARRRHMQQLAYVKQQASDYYAPIARQRIEHFIDLSSHHHCHDDEFDEFVLSFGEKLILLLLLWSFHADQLDKASDSCSSSSRADHIGANKLRLVLFDEVDGHLAPALIAEFVRLVLGTKFARLHFQLIVSTHNTLTISLAPVAHLFLMASSSSSSSSSSTGSSQNATLYQTKSKKRAMSLLANETSAVDVSNKWQRQRIVFVPETHSDYVKLVADYLIRAGGLIEDESLLDQTELVFLPLSDAGDDEVVAPLGGDEMSGWDMRGLKRHDMTNYIYDPLNVHFYLTLTRTHAAPLAPQLLAPLQFICNLTDVFSMSKANLHDFYQRVVDHYEATFRQHMCAEDEDQESSDRTSTRVDVEFLYERCNAATSDDDTVTVSTYCVSYPSMFVEMSGRRLQRVYARMYPQLADQTCLVEFMRAKIFAKMMLNNRRFPECLDYYRVLPLDLVRNLQRLFASQSSAAHKLEIENIPAILATQTIDTIDDSTNSSTLKEQDIVVIETTTTTSVSDNKCPRYQQQHLWTIETSEETRNLVCIENEMNEFRMAECQSLMLRRRISMETCREVSVSRTRLFSVYRSIDSCLYNPIK